jgi:3-oxoacyl-[acyl-carrier-protein] synthase-3
MSSNPGFRRFESLNEQDAPDLLQRMTKSDLPVDGQRYGILSRLIALPDTSVADLAERVTRKLCEFSNVPPGDLGAVVLSSRIVQVQEAAETAVRRLGLRCGGHGVERACSGFPAATALAVQLCRQSSRPVAVVTAEIISRNINWEPGTGNLADHRRARGQAAKLFADGAAAALLEPGRSERLHEILDVWSGNVPDSQRLIQKTDVENSMDPWGNRRAGSTTCISMPGRRGFLLLKRAPQIMLDSLIRSVENATQAGCLEDGQVSEVIPHQANGLIISALRKRLAEGPFNGPVRVWDCIAQMGNTVSASIPSAMAEVQDKIPAGAVVGMPAVGAEGPGYVPDVLSTGCVLIRMGRIT